MIMFSMIVILVMFCQESHTYFLLIEHKAI